MLDPPLCLPIPRPMLALYRKLIALIGIRRHDLGVHRRLWIEIKHPPDCPIARGMPLFPWETSRRSLFREYQNLNPPVFEHAFLRRIVRYGFGFPVPLCRYHILVGIDHAVLQEVVFHGCGSPLGKSLVVFRAADVIRMTFYGNLIARILLDEIDRLLKLCNVRFPDVRLVEVEIDMNDQASFAHLPCSIVAGSAEIETAIAGGGAMTGAGFGASAFFGQSAFARAVASFALAIPSAVRHAK